MAYDELDVRRTAMAYVARIIESGGGVITRAQLEAFTYQGEPIKLIDQSRGIRNPRQLTATLSILSQAVSPYDDEETVDGLLRYAYRAGSVDGGDNRKLRRAAELGLPLILLKGIDPGVFVPVFPVYVVNDDPAGRRVEITVDESLRFMALGSVTEDSRQYAERPVVVNGMAMCKIHHAAFDRGIIGVWCAGRAATVGGPARRAVPALSRRPQDAVTAAGRVGPGASSTARTRRSQRPPLPAVGDFRRDAG